MSPYLSDARRRELALPAALLLEPCLVMCDYTQAADRTGTLADELARAWQALSAA